MTKAEIKEIRDRVEAEFENRSYYVRKDLDAMLEGWNPMEYPEDSRVAEHVIEELDIDADDDEAISEVYNTVTEIFEEIQEEIDEINEEEEEEEEEEDE